MNLVEAEEVVKALEEACQEAGGASQWVEQIGRHGYDVTPGYVSQVKTRRTPPGEAVLAPLGFRKRILFERVRR